MNTALRYIFIFLFCFATHELCAQREANTWYFGRFLGLDFNSGAAVPLNDGLLNTTEGVATISNSNGALLFYTDGIIVRNRLHQVMPNGNGLFGDASSSQSAVIVPKIGDTTRYYVFTVDQLGGPKGLCYSVVNMTLDNGKGDVELKNVPVISNVVEKITAVRHCNNRDVWVVAHKTVSDTYYSFLVSPTGVNTTPVVSNTGVVLPGVVPPSSIDSTTLGYMKASPDGKKIAAAHWTVNADVSDFNNVTGVVSNTYSLFPPGDPHYLIYGIEFSPDSRLVYTTVFYTDPVNAQKRNALFQYDVSSGVPASVRATKQVVSQNADPIQTYAALQIAPDGKMYMAKNTYTHIASINSPNIAGAGCGFTSNAVQYTNAGQTSSFGLPTFVQSYFYPVDSFTYTASCSSLNVSFNYTPAPNVLSVLWNFGDPASGPNNSSTLNSPVHTYTAAGVYNVQLIRFTTCGSDTLRKLVQTDAVSVNLGADTLVCGTTSLLLNSAGASLPYTFLWQDGSTTPTFSATTSGLYWVEARNIQGCVKRDSINVTFKPRPVYNLGTDTAICAGDTLMLNATVTNATSYLWNTTAITPTIKAFQVGAYWCDVNKEGCIFRDTLNITAIIAKPIVNLGNDISVCGNNPILLNATNPNCTYLWQNGSTNATLSATTSGLYWVEVRNTTGCFKRDSINIAFNSIPVFNLGADTAICQSDTLTLNATVTSATSYLWNTGATTPTIRVYQAGLYWSEVNNGCIFRDTLNITAVIAKPIVNFGNDISVCGNNPILLNATNPNCTYLWQNGSTTAALSATTSGLYWVEVRNTTGCFKRDSINIAFNSIPVFSLGSDTAICQSDTLTLNASVATAVSYLWSNGATTSSIKAYQPGLYWCEVNNGCVYRDSMTITAVMPKPVVNFGSDVTLCAGNTVTLDATNPNAMYLWQNGSTNPVFAATVSGLYWAEVRSNNGCFRRDSINITFNPLPVFNLGSDKDICVQDTLLLNATVTNATSYQWSTGVTTSSVNAYQAGLFWCEVNKLGCIFRDSITIISVKPLPVVNLGNDLILCEGITTNLNATYLNSTYRWQDGNTNAIYTVSQPGSYSVQVDLNGCKRSDTVNVLYNLKPRFTLGADQTICTGNTIVLSPALNPAWQLSWQDGSTNSIFNITQPGTYSLSATNSCGTNMDDITVTKGYCNVIVPTAFTPNSDGLNDLFKVLGTENVSEFNLTIFNRWGQIVFETADKTKGWNGKLNGQDSPIGVYVYMLKYTEGNLAEPQLLKGTLTLIK